jgi:hypothetical protein
MDAICAVGGAPDGAVVALTQAALVAWGETMVRGDGEARSKVDGSSSSSGSGESSISSVSSSVSSSFSSNVSSSNGSEGYEGGEGQELAAPGVPPRLRMGLDADGNVVAGLASWDAASRLFATTDQARQLLAEGGGMHGSSGKPLQVEVRLKNFELLLN